MKLSGRQGAIAALIAAAAGALFLGVGGVGPRGGRAAPEPERTPQAAPHGATPALPRFTELPRPEQRMAQRDEPQVATPDDEPTSDDYEDNSMGDFIHTILVNDKMLDTYMYYHNRPLLDEGSLVQYHQILSDRSMLADVKGDLLYPEEKKATPVGNIRRLMKIDYLRDALDWKENPRREEVLSLIAEMLLTDNYPADMGMDMRISLSGNKMELYELLAQEAPDRAEAVLEKAKGTRLEAMLAYIANSLEVRKQIERNLENEVTL